MCHNYYEEITERAVNANRKLINKVVKAINSFELSRPEARQYRLNCIRKHQSTSLQSRFVVERNTQRKESASPKA